MACDWNCVRAVWHRGLLYFVYRSSVIFQMSLEKNYGLRARWVQLYRNPPTYITKDEGFLKNSCRNRNVHGSYLKVETVLLWWFWTAYLVCWCWWISMRRCKMCMASVCKSGPSTRHLQETHTLLALLKHICMHMFVQTASSCLQTSVTPAVTDYIIQIYYI